MDKAGVYVFYGNGAGKTSAAIGLCLRRLGEGRTAVVVQFLKGSDAEKKGELLKRLEPELKFFSFEKNEEKFSELDPEHKEEEMENIRNGLNFVRKVISTGGCDVLVLDEILGLVEHQILSADALAEMISSRPEEMEMILTGDRIDDRIRSCADIISKVTDESKT